MRRNKIHKLLDEQYVIELFNKILLPKYQVFDKILKVIITTPKKHIWEDDFYHVVIKYRIVFLTTEKKRKRLTFYGVAHSHELRKNVFDALNYLWSHNFNKGYLTIPHPIAFNEEFNASFYRGVDGHHLFYYMKKDNLEEIEKIVVKTAKWFAKLHKLPVGDNIGLDPKNNRISTVVPGVNSILYKISQLYPEFLDDYKKLYDLFISKENEYLDNQKSQCLVHGDAHPENIIRMSEKKLALIDFADMGVGDYTRDLGTFLQQFEYMMPRCAENVDVVERLKKLFLEVYFKEKKVKLTKEIEARIDNYYNWTMLRTATYFFIKEKPEFETGKILFDRLLNKLIR